MKPWRLIDTGVSDPFWNMAADEAIAQAVRSGWAPPTLRFYGWPPPSISIGYFQRLPEIVDTEACKRHGIVVVRRITGGGAVLHNQDITYSVSAGVDTDGFRNIRETYATVAQSIACGLKRLGISVHILPVRPAPRPRPAYCFAHAAPHEITYRGRKLIGSAQRRWREAFLQHGSIPFQTDPDPMRWFRGNVLVDGPIALEECLGGRVDPLTVRNHIAKGFETVLNTRMTNDKLSEQETTLLEGLIEKYRTWTHPD